MEVYYNGQWQTVCNSYRTFQDVGDLVCGQLGYGLVSRMRANYRTTSSNTVFVSCSGGQSSLRECSFTEAGTCYTTVRVLCSNSSECNSCGIYIYIITYNIIYIYIYIFKYMHICNIYIYIYIK